jgi:hypothetical protein
MFFLHSKRWLTEVKKKNQSKRTNQHLKYLSAKPRGILGPVWAVRPGLLKIIYILIIKYISLQEIWAETFATGLKTSNVGGPDEPSGLTTQVIHSWPLISVLKSTQKEDAIDFEQNSLSAGNTASRSMPRMQASQAARQRQPCLCLYCYWSTYLVHSTRRLLI